MPGAFGDRKRIKTTKEIKIDKREGANTKWDLEVDVFAVFATDV